jgi:hypothetical protein
LKLKFFLINLIALIPSVLAQTYPWDYLRPISKMAVSYDFYTRVFVLILSLILTAISTMAYLKVKSQRLMFVSIAFSLFVVKWMLKVLDLIISPGNFFNDASQNVFELLILASLFYALFMKK